MKKLSLLLTVLVLIPSLLLTSCDKGDDTINGPTSEPTFTVLKDYMLSNDLDLGTLNAGKVANAPALADLDAFLNSYYIIDIRAEVDYNANHINGAKNVAWANILAEGAAAEAVNKPVLIVCYSGQSACYATALMRMYGYTNTKALKWGMSSWNELTAGPWNSKEGLNEAEGHANWTYAAAPTNILFDEPTITSYSTNGSDILKERVEQVLAEGFKRVSGTDVLNNPGNYFINNYFNAADYSGFGHIDGSYRIQPLSLVGTSYKNLDPAAISNTVIYCYTGQTSALTAAWLRVLGYDAYSLTYGVNGMYHTNPAWSTNHWGQTHSAGTLPLVN
jgi:rhodanese-related sulfurtransferase